MFGRQVTMKLKNNAATELTRIAESEIIPILRRQKGFRDETIFIAGTVRKLSATVSGTRRKTQKHSAKLVTLKC